MKKGYIKGLIIAAVLAGVVIMSGIKVNVEPKVAEAQVLTENVEAALRRAMSSNPDGAFDALKVAVTANVDGPTARAILRAWTLGLTIPELDDVTDDREDTLLRRSNAAYKEIYTPIGAANMFTALRTAVVDNHDELKIIVDTEDE